MSSPVIAPSERVEMEPIPLPEPRTSGRSRHRAKRRRQARRRFLLRLLAVIVVVGLVVVGASSFLGGDPDATTGNGRSPAAAAAPPVPPVLFALQDGRGQAGSVFVLAPGTSGKGGSLLLVAPGTMTEVASLGLQPIGEALSLGGPARLKATIENVLGATLAEVVVVDGAGFTAMVTPAGPLTVDVPDRVETQDAAGTVAVQFAAGRTLIPPGDAGRFLGLPSKGNDLTRLARHQAWFTAWIEQLAKNPTAVPAQPPALRAALTALAAGSFRTQLVPVTALGTGQGDSAYQLYQVERDELAKVVAQVFPGGARTAGTRPRVQILNGAGGVGMAQTVNDRLGAGFDVTLTGNAGNFDYDQTKIVFYDKARQADAERVRTSLGLGTLVYSRQPLDVVDVTIIVGKDFK
jgi:hypothetical protein